MRTFAINKVRGAGRACGVAGLALALTVSMTACSGDKKAAQPADMPSAADPSNPCPVPSTKPKSAAPKLTKPDLAAVKNTVTATVATSCGPISLELFGDKAPMSVSNFKFLAEQKYFNDTNCHRLTVEGIFVLQCGDPTATGTGGPGYTYGPVENAPSDDKYPAGTLAMARRGGNGESQGSQFFIVYKDSEIPHDNAGGYSVFGKVTQGLDVVQRIAEGGVASDGGAGVRGVAPRRPITLQGVTFS